jgi:hypothetical protein
MESIGYISVIPATRTCTPERHTFLTTLIPPRAEQLCECGAQTWRQACEDARSIFEADELERLRLWNEAAKQ